MVAPDPQLLLGPGADAAPNLHFVPGTETVHHFVGTANPVDKVHIIRRGPFLEATEIPQG